MFVALYHVITATYIVINEEGWERKKKKTDFEHPFFSTGCWNLVYWLHILLHAGKIVLRQQSILIPMQNSNISL